MFSTTSAYQGLTHRILALPGSLPITALFEQFASEPMALLLDSCDSDHVNVRYDIVVARPLVTLKAIEGDTWIVGEQQTLSDQDPFTTAKALHQQLYGNASGPIDADLPDLPFGAGLAGYFGYDLGRYIEQLPDSRARVSEMPDMALGLYSWSVIKDRLTGQWHYLSDPRFACPTPEALESMARTPAQEADFALCSSWQANMSRQEYQNSIEKIHQYLRSGDCYQVNFAQAFSARYRGDEWQAFKTLREVNKGPFSAFMRMEQAAILSISPERFISVREGRVETKPIKGTRPRLAEPAADLGMRDELLHAEKDRSENLMIVDLLRNDLSKHCTPESVKVPSLFAIESFPAVHHLVSTVTGILKADAHPLDLLKGAFPGGSITGAPKIRAMEVIEELEPHRRHIYCGSMGYVGAHGDMDTSICIRTLLAEKGEVRCWAGGGIVMDSVATEEYQESLDKVARILPVLESNSAPG